MTVEGFVQNLWGTNNNNWYFDVQLIASNNNNWYFDVQLIASSLQLFCKSSTLDVRKTQILAHCKDGYAVTGLGWIHKKGTDGPIQQKLPSPPRSGEPWRTLEILLKVVVGVGTTCKITIGHLGFEFTSWVWIYIGQLEFEFPLDILGFTLDIWSLNSHCTSWGWISLDIFEFGPGPLLNGGVFFLDPPDKSWLPVSSSSATFGFRTLGLKLPHHDIQTLTSM